MMHCLTTANSDNGEMSVLERHRLKLQQQLIQQLPVTYFNANQHDFLGDQALCDLLMKPNPVLANGLPDDFPSFEFELGYALPCPAEEKICSKKRKADKSHNLKEIGGEKKMRGGGEDDSKSNNKSTTTSATTSTNTKKEAPKTDYIHVRARRGQATDSHSLAERVRREKISERMKYLQDLVPGCNKITGKAGMLDEIINYVQSLQRQVEFLSMKLAAINPRLDFDLENYLLKEIIPTMGASSSDQFNLQLLGQGSVSGSNLGIGSNPMDMAGLRRTTSAPIPHNSLDSSNLNQITWEDELQLQNLYNMEYQQGRFITHPFTGFQEGHVKLEM